MLSNLQPHRLASGGWVRYDIRGGCEQYRFRQRRDQRVGRSVSCLRCTDHGSALRLGWSTSPTLVVGPCSHCMPSVQRIPAHGLPSYLRLRPIVRSSIAYHVILLTSNYNLVLGLFISFGFIGLYSAHSLLVQPLMDFTCPHLLSSSYIST